MWGAWTQVRPGERRDAVIAFASLFCFIAAHSLMETARDALFLARLPVSELPFVYLAAAAVAFVATRVTRGAAAAAGPGLSMGVLVAAAFTAALGIIAGSGAVWTLYAIYIWSAVMVTLLVGYFYVHLGDRFTVTQAKRLYAFIGAGSVAGAIAGNAIAAVLAPMVPPRMLLTVAALVLAASAVGPMMLRRAPDTSAKASADAEPAMPLAQVWRTPYSRRLGLLMIITTATLTAVDFVFKSAVVEAVDPGDLAVFFARFYLAVSIASLVTQLWLVRPLVRVLNTYGALMILPALLAMGTLGLGLLGGMFAAVALKGAGGTLRHSLHSTATELLFVPMPNNLRKAAKTTIDMIGQRAGQAAASLAILGAIAMSATAEHLCMAIFAMCLCWLGIAFSMRGDYVRLLRETLSASALREDAFPELDLGSLESLIAALNSQDDLEVTAALHLLEERGRANLIPALILYHPSPDVVEQALDLLTRSGRKDFLPVAQRLATHEYAAVRAASLRAQIAIDPQESILRERLDVTCPVVRATAIVGLAAKGYAGQDETGAAIEEVITGGSEVAREALAKAITYRPGTGFDDVLIRLADDPSRMVQLAATTAMAQAPSARFLPHLLRMLPVRQMREHVRRVLVAMGDTGMQFVVGALMDPDTPVRVRRHLPRTLHRFAPERAAPVLVEQLAREHDGVVRFKILRALGRLKTEQPDLVLDKTVLREQADAALSSAFRLIDWRVTLERGRDGDSELSEVHQLLVTLVADKEQRAIERLFRIFGLLQPKSDMVTLYRGLRSAHAAVRASSRELLEHVVPSRWRDAVVALVDDGGDALRLQGAGEFHTHEERTYDELILALAGYENRAVRLLAEHRAGELALRLPTPVPAPKPAGQRLSEAAMAVLRGRERSPA